MVLFGCFFVKWQILLQVTFQAYKSSTFPRQHHTLKSSTVWILSLVVHWRTHRKTRPLLRKIPQNTTKAERSSSSVAIIFMQMHTDHFSADPFWSYEFVRLRTKGLTVWQQKDPWTHCFFFNWYSVVLD